MRGVEPVRPSDGTSSAFLSSLETVAKASELTLVSLLEGTPRRDASDASRVSWDELLVIFDNAGRLFNHEELQAIGRDLVMGPALARVRAVGPMIESAELLYALAMLDEDSPFFATDTQIESSENEVHVVMRAPAGARMSRAFLVAAEAALAAIPKACGFERADVERSGDEDEARFLVRCTGRSSTLTRVGRLLAAPSQTQRAVEQILRAAWARDAALRDHRSPAASPPEDPEGSIPPPPVGAATIVIAEDDDVLRRALVRMLSSEYRVFAAENGRIALELATRHSPDLLLCDLDMPEMGGLELIRRFRALAGQRLAGAIVLTAQVELTQLLESFEAGAMDFVRKPFEAEELKVRIRSQLSMRQMALRLNESAKLSAMGQLVAGVAHEMRNPANALVNAISPLRREMQAELREGSAAEQLFEVVETCSLEIADLARNLLELHSDRDLKQSRNRIPALLRRANALAHASIRDVEYTEQLEYEGEVLCAGSLLTQVLVNLLENAGHALDGNGRITVRTRREEGTVRFMVDDTGPGVPTELRDRIFEPFFTTKPIGEGTGLGLTTAYRIVERHAGRLSYVPLESGARFVVELPDIAAPSEEIS